MEGGYSRKDENMHPQLLDLISTERNWLVNKDDNNSNNNIQGSKGHHENGDEKKLVLKLGPPGLDDWCLSDTNNSPQKAPKKRSAPGPVVGWPPIRSFRKNIGSSSLKPAPVKKEQPVESCQKGFFVKINMTGVPIGRKVDLNAFDTYAKLSLAVDQLFSGLLAAQNDTSGGRTNEGITGLLNRNGEYTLVYEDNEGDRMLVGDVPWEMFVSSVKRLRVIKSSEISNICCLGNRQEKLKL